MIALNAALENDADTFSQNYLVPADEYRRFNPSTYTSESDIIEFARKINIHPGIVVGRLQHDKIIPPARFTHLKSKYKIVI